MKARELIEILAAHPDWVVGFADPDYGGMECEMEALNIELPGDYNVPANTFLITGAPRGNDAAEE